MKLLKQIALILLTCSPVLLAAQEVEETLIVKDAGDSLFLKAFRSAFDSSGNYYFETLLQFGVAKGLSKGGVTDYYWVTSFPFY